MTVIDEIAAERRRQIEQEGWTVEHDDHYHSAGGLARAAAAYALSGSGEHAITFVEYRETVFSRYGSKERKQRRSVISALWPWAREWWKPKNPRQDLVRAGALVVAEIERLDRAAALKETDTAPDNLRLE